MTSQTIFCSHRLIKKSDWNNLKNMPVNTTTFVMAHCYSSEEMELIKQGYKPTCMEQKWFIYFEDNKLYFHRSWSGNCIYILDFSKTGQITVTANKEFRHNMLEYWSAEEEIKWLIHYWLIKMNSD